VLVAARSQCTLRDMLSWRLLTAVERRLFQRGEYQPIA